MDGTCAIEALVYEGTSASVSMHDVATGALAVTVQCIEGRYTSEGGLAKDFGESLLLPSVDPKS